MNWPILSTVTYLPLAGAAIIFFLLRGDSEAVKRNIRIVALGVTDADLPRLAPDLVELRFCRTRASSSSRRPAGPAPS